MCGACKQACHSTQYIPQTDLDGNEVGATLVSHCLGNKCLAAARRPIQQYTCKEHGKARQHPMYTSIMDVSNACTPHQAVRLFTSDSCCTQALAQTVHSAAAVRAAQPERQCKQYGNTSSTVAVRTSGGSQAQGLEALWVHDGLRDGE